MPVTERQSVLATKINGGTATQAEITEYLSLNKELNPFDKQTNPAYNQTNQYISQISDVANDHRLSGNAEAESKLIGAAGNFADAKVASTLKDADGNLIDGAKRFKDISNITGAVKVLDGALRVGQGLAADIGVGVREGHLKDGMAEDMRFAALSQQQKGPAETYGDMHLQDSGVFAEDGGQISRLASGAVTGLPEGNKFNSILEDREHILDQRGGSTEVVGRTHDEGGEKRRLEGDARIVSDNVIVDKKRYSEIFKEDRITLGKKATPASLISQFEKKQGIVKLDKEQEKYIKKLGKTENILDVATKAINIEHISGKIREIEIKKEEKAGLLEAFNNKVYAVQEEIKQDPNYKTLRKKIPATEEVSEANKHLVEQRPAQQGPPQQQLPVDGQGAIPIFREGGQYFTDSEENNVRFQKWALSQGYDSMEKVARHFQDGGGQPTHQMPDGTVMSGAAHSQQEGGEQQEVLQQMASAIQQGADPEQILQQAIESGIPQEQAVQMVEMAMQQGQGQPQQGGQEEMMQMVAQALQEGVQPEEIMQGLVQQGVPEEQAGQVIQSVMQQMQGGQGQGGQDEMMQMVGKALQEGAQPEELMQVLVQQGIPEEQAAQVIQSVMSQMQGGQEQPQGAGGQEELAQMVAQALQGGAPPEELMQALVQQGLPEEQAGQLIQGVMQQMQGQQQPQPQQGPSQLQNGGRVDVFQNAGDVNVEYGFDLDKFVDRLIYFEGLKGDGNGNGLSIAEFTANTSVGEPATNRTELVELVKKYWKVVKGELNGEEKNLSPEILTELLDYKMNSGRNTGDLLNFSQGGIDLDEINSNNVYGIPKKLTANLDQLLKAKHTVYKSMNSTTYKNTWQDRVGNQAGTTANSAKYRIAAGEDISTVLSNFTGQDYVSGSVNADEAISLISDYSKKTTSSDDNTSFDQRWSEFENGVDNKNTATPADVPDGLVYSGPDKDDSEGEGLVSERPDKLKTKKEKKAERLQTKLERITGGTTEESDASQTVYTDTPYQPALEYGPEKSGDVNALMEQIKGNTLLERSGDKPPYGYKKNLVAAKERLMVVYKSLGMDTTKLEAAKDFGDLDTAAGVYQNHIKTNSPELFNEYGGNTVSTRQGLQSLLDSDALNPSMQLYKDLEVAGIIENGSANRGLADASVGIKKGVQDFVGALDEDALTTYADKNVNDGLWNYRALAKDDFWFKSKDELTAFVENPTDDFEIIKKDGKTYAKQKGTNIFNEIGYYQDKKLDSKEEYDKLELNLNDDNYDESRDGEYGVRTSYQYKGQVERKIPPPIIPPRKDPFDNYRSYPAIASMMPPESLNLPTLNTLATNYVPPIKVSEEVGARENERIASATRQIIGGNIGAQRGANLANANKQAYAENQKLVTGKNIQNAQLKYQNDVLNLNNRNNVDQFNARAMTQYEKEAGMAVSNTYNDQANWWTAYQDKKFGARREWRTLNNIDSANPNITYDSQGRIILDKNKSIKLQKQTEVEKFWNKHNPENLV